MKILVFGGNGMVGHTISLYLSEKGHEVKVFSRRKGLFDTIIGDIEDLLNQNQKIEFGYFDFVINSAGILNTDVNKNLSKSILINSYFPHFLVKETRDLKTKILHLSTDCVFSGKKGGYSENDYKDGNTAYDISKSIGEVNDLKNLTFRNSIIGPDTNSNGIGLLNWFFKQKNQINGFNNVFWNGVTSLELAKAIDFSFSQSLVGLYHLVSNTVISKYDLLCLINKEFNIDKMTIVNKSVEYSNKSLLNTRIDFKFKVASYPDMLREMHKWMLKHKHIYPHYAI